MSFHYDVCCLHIVMRQTFFERVEDNNRQKKSPNVEMAKKQDPYEGSTDENTDVETEGDHPIPELPGGCSSFCVIV